MINKKIPFHTSKRKFRSYVLNFKKEFVLLMLRENETFFRDIIDGSKEYRN